MLVIFCFYLLKTKVTYVFMIVFTTQQHHNCYKEYLHMYFLTL